MGKVKTEPATKEQTELELLKELVAEYGWSRIRQMYVDGGKSAEDIKAALEERKTRASVMNGLRP